MKEFQNKNNNRFKSVNGSGMDILGTINISLTVQNSTIYHPFYVAIFGTSNIMGQVVIQKLGIVIDSMQCCIKPSFLHGELKQIQSFQFYAVATDNILRNVLRAKRKYIIKPGHTQLVDVQGVSDQDNWVSQPILVEDTRTNDFLCENHSDEINSQVRVRSGLYDMNKYQKATVQVSSFSCLDLEIERTEIMGVFDTLTQPPIEGFKHPERDLIWI